MSAPRNTRTRDFRLIRGEGGNFKCQYYATKEARDAAGPKFAQQDGTDVIGESWDPELSQDSLNQGWGCDAVYRYVVMCEYYALCDHPADGVTEHPILGDVPTCTRCATKHDLTLKEFS